MRGSIRIATALLACAACKETPPKPPTNLVLGQVIDRSGSIATPSWADSIRLAIGTANQALKQAGHAELHFSVAEANSGNAPDLARAGALEVLKQGAKAIITDSSQDDIAINMLAYGGGSSPPLDVPVVCMACTSPQIDNPAATDADPLKQSALRNEKGWNFRTTMSDSYQARVLAGILASTGKNGDVNADGRLKVSIYASDDPYGRGFSDTLKKDLLARVPGASVEQLSHDVKADPVAYDWGKDVARLTDKRNETTGQNDGVPDAVVAISFPKFEIHFTKAFLASGTKVRLIHAHNFRATRVLEALSSAVNGQEGTSQAVLGDGDSARIFAEDLKAMNGQVPAFRDAAAYDAAMSLILATLQAVKRNGLADASQVTGAMIRDSMHAINDKGGEAVSAGSAGFARAVSLIDQGKAIDYQGASGPCDYDAHGDVVAQLARFRVQAGQFLDVEKFDCVRDPLCPALKELGSR